MKPLYHFPVTLGYDEVENICLPDKDRTGRETDFLKYTFACNGVKTVYSRFCAKLQAYKQLGAAQQAANMESAAAPNAGTANCSPVDAAISASK